MTANPPVRSTCGATVRTVAISAYTASWSPRAITALDGGEDVCFVIVGGCATYQAALHLMRTGAAGVLVGFGGGAASTTRASLGIHAPMATAVADVAGARRDYMDESGGRYVHVIADGGVGTAGDIVKAIASGADLVGIGRLQCWALAAAGEDGIVRMLELLEDEVLRCLGLLGATSFAEVNKSCLHQATATNVPSVFSAFPLFDHEPYRY